MTTTDLVSWLAPALARFELPDPTATQLNLPLAFNQAFGLDLTGSQLVPELAAAVLRESGGKVSLSPTPAPSVGLRAGANLRLTGHRLLTLGSGAPYVEWVD